MIKKKILFIEEGRPSKTGGFGGSFYSMLETIRLLQNDSKYEFAILTYYEVPAIYNLIDTSTIEYDYVIPFVTFINTQNNKGPRKKTKSKMPFFIKTDLKAYMSLGRVKPYLKIINQIKPNIIWGNNMASVNFAVLISSIIKNIPYIQHQRAELSVVSFNYLVTLVFSKKIISISEYIKLTLVKNKIVNFLFKKKNVVVYNFNINFKNEKIFKEKKLNEICFVFMGRLIPQKKIEEFLEILYEIKKANFSRPISAQIYGDWEDQVYKKEIIELTKELELDRIVSFNQFSEKEEIFKEDKLNFLFHTTRIETPEPFGRVLLDAIYYGAVVVTNGYGGTGEVILDKGNGIIYDINNINNLIENIKFYDQNPVDYFLDLNKFYKKTVLDFSGEKQLKKLMSIINQIIQ